MELCSEPNTGSQGLASFRDASFGLLGELALAGKRVGAQRRREPLNEDVRLYVYWRDMGICQWCGLEAPLDSMTGMPSDLGAFPLDHIVPHAAGGCDHSHNLRVLCQSCNSGRSNRRTDHFARAVPVAQSCVRCEHIAERQQDDDTTGELYACFCGWCCAFSRAPQSWLL